MKFSAVATNSSPAKTDYLMGVTAAGVDNRILIGTVLNLIWPVGSIYTNASDSTNPGTLLGFGTWAAFAQGQMPIGQNPSDTDFATIGATGGEKAHSLSGDENGVHSHGIYDPGHNHSSANGQQVAIQASSTNKLSSSGNAAQITWGNTTTSNNGANLGIYNSGSGNPHNNMPPYVVVYMWKRTA